MSHIDKLEKLGYFKYANFSDVTELKYFVSECITKYQELDTIYFENLETSFIAKEYRYILVDFESLYEFGGTEDILERLAFSFHKFNLPFEWELTEKYYAGFESETINISINQKDYILRYGDEWDFYATEFAKAINNQLNLLKSDEKLYMIASGNSGDFVFLNQPLYDYVSENKLCKDGFMPYLPK